ncbi:hypothetical protein QLQ12_25075 [Actinoplanes sp. NEAU-A12]|uniref:Uncharacterized protein n=1 Tax=Actinoplanes sandaracinus TaxID=3045177 RepID=A0ABT6WQ71_9ACTN|nr:hypothetical protein [Actinoplanes sandaracinus]MDI6101896.1 hypothetical protein [Actinoplanes sandaracinus]
MLNPTHLLLMLDDGARAARQAGEDGAATVLTAMADSLVASLKHRDDIPSWRQDDLRAIRERVS